MLGSYPSFSRAPILSLLVACASPSTTDEPVDTDPPTTSSDLEGYCGEDWASVERRIDDLLNQLTLEQKVDLMAGEAILPVTGTWDVNGVPDLGIPGLHMLDGPRGVSRFAGVQATAFPVGMARGATWDPELERRVGVAMGTEIRNSGADVILAPTMNILRHPLWGRAQETYGEDPVHMGEMAVGFIEGVQSVDVLASAKHYAVNSIEDTRFDVDVQLSERTLREVYLPHFRRAVQDAHVASVMSAYNSVNGTYCSENAHLMSILKDEWGFAGFVESDWIWGTNSTVDAVNAGLDIEMPMPNFFDDKLTRAVEDGDVELEVIDNAVRRILRAQFCFELDTNPPQRNESLLHPDEHIDLAREVAQKSLVLLANEGGLPLADDATVVVLGRNADEPNIGDTGSSAVDPPYVVTALQGLTDRSTGSVTHIDGQILDADDHAAIAAADVVVVVTGFDKDDEGENTVSAGDRDQLQLPDGEPELIQAVAALNDRVVVVLEGGAAITMDGWVDDVQAVVMAWYPGMEGGNAIADLVYGDVNFTGRLPIVFPAALDDLPPFDNVSLQVDYGYLHGYRWLQDAGTPPLFAFGHGLSYTEVSYESMTLADDVVGADDTLTATVTVTNTGEVDTVETVQAYISTLGSSVERAERSLVTFARIPIESGQTVTADLDIEMSDIAYYDESVSDWVVETIFYSLMVGPNAGTQPLVADFEVQ